MSYLIAVCTVFFAVFVFLSYKYEFYKIEYNPSKISHNTLIYFCVGFCVVISSVIFYFLSKGNFEYPFIKPLENMNAYEQQFDAFIKHRLSIDIVPDMRLSEIVNPYDCDMRNELGVNYLWDRAYYNGNYYSYFGIAPILLIYFPFYFITGKVPESNTVCYILSVIAVVSIAFLVMKFQQIFVKKPNLIVLILSIIACEFGSLVYCVQASADMYYTAVASGLAFLSLFLLLSFCAYEEKNYKKRSVFFFFSGFALVLLVLSRPNMVIFFLMILPIYFSTIFSKKYNYAQKLLQVFSFAVPTIIGAILIMRYNYLRFDSILEFGAKYQLTVHDVSDYAITPLLILPTIKYYFLQLPVFSTKAPYFDIPFVPLKNYDNYLYVTSTIGAMAFPVNWSLVLSPLFINKRLDKIKLSVFALGTISILTLAFMDMCLAGVNIRYLADIMLVMVLLSTTVIADFSSVSQDEKSKAKFIYYLLSVIILILSIIIGVFLTFINERDNLLNLISK